MCTMSLSCEESANCMNKMHASQLMRNTSSLSTESSEFEFEFHDEPPLSPKPLFSPNYSTYTPNHFPDAESFLKASTNQYWPGSDYILNRFPDTEIHGSKASTDYQHCAERHYTREGATLFTNAANFEQNLSMPSLSGANSESGDDNARIKGASNDNQQDLWGRFGDNHTNNDNYGPNDVVNEGKRGTSLRSLLNRRDLGQLAPLTNYNDSQYKESFPASAISPSSSSLNYHANHSSNFCKCNEDDCPDSTDASTSPPDSRSSKKKTRKWTFNLDFLKKSPSPRADQALNRRASTDNYSDDSLNHGIKPNQEEYFGAAAATEEGRLDNNFQERDYYNGAATPREGGNQRIDHYRAAAAAGEARFNRIINQSINVNYRAGGDQQQINQGIDHYRVSASSVVTKYESPRQSTCSVISSVSSSPRHADIEMIRANHKKISRSGPLSPAGSPPRSPHAAAAGDQGAFTRGRRPMSPHALHYQQKKAHEDEHRRKTFLPYRQSLLGACFFPISTHPHHPQQAVY